MVETGATSHNNQSQKKHHGNMAKACDHFAFFTSSKNYHLKASTPAEVEGWIRDLKAIIDKPQNTSSNEKRRHSMIPQVQFQGDLDHEGVTVEDATVVTPTSHSDKRKSSSTASSLDNEQPLPVMLTAPAADHDAMSDASSFNPRSEDEDDKPTSNPRKISNSSALSSSTWTTNTTTASTIQPAQPEPVLEQGYLYRKRRHYHTWVKHYARLTPSTLSLYKSDSAAHLAAAPLKSFSIESLVDVVDQDEVSKKKEWCVLLIARDSQVQLAFKTEEELVRWLAALKLQIDKCHSK